MGAGEFRARMRELELPAIQRKEHNMSFPGVETTEQQPQPQQANGPMPAQDDPFAEARANLDEGQAPAWKPVKDPSHPREVVGRVARIERVTIADGASAPVVTLEDEHGRLFAVWLWHTTLLSGFQRLRPKVGDVVAIRYEGEQISAGSGRKFHKYSVGRAGEPETGDFDWDDGQSRSRDREPTAPPVATVDVDDEIPF